MANVRELHHHNGKHRGGDRRSEKARAHQAGRVALVTEIAERRQRLNQNFYDHLRRLRQLHGDRAVDQALSVWREQRNAVAIVPDEQEPERRGPRFHY